MDIDKRLEDALDYQLSVISSAEDGSEEKTKAISDFVAMNEAQLERNKVKAEETAKKQETIFKALGCVAEGAKTIGIVGGIVVLTAVGYKFEETGAQTSQTFKRVQDWTWKFLKL